MFSFRIWETSRNEINGEIHDRFTKRKPRFIHLMFFNLEHTGCGRPLDEEQLTWISPYLKPYFKKLKKARKLRYHLGDWIIDRRKLNFIIKHIEDTHNLKASIKYIRMDIQNNYKYYFNIASKKSDSKCSWCKTENNLTIDHIIPVSKGGNNKASNLQLLCNRCNSRKSNKIIM